jgi:hypothetical protein
MRGVEDPPQPHAQEASPTAARRICRKALLDLEIVGSLRGK